MTNLNVNGKRAKVSAAYWKFFCGREPRVGDIHVADGIEHRVTSISGGLVYVSKRRAGEGRR